MPLYSFLKVQFSATKKKKNDTHKEIRKYGLYMGEKISIEIVSEKAHYGILKGILLAEMKGHYT